MTTDEHRTDTLPTGPSPASGTSAAELVACARGSVDNLAPSAFAEQLGAGALVLDVREPHETEAGTIDGATCVPRGMLEFRADPRSPYHLEGFDPGRPVLLYCASGGRSALAGATLRALGYRHVGHLDGGVAAWTGEGRPLS